MFQIGDKAVYPGHGVGVIEAIETKQISGRELMFYILRILDNGMTIMIPRDNVEAVGLRGVIRKLEVPKVIRILKDRDVTSTTRPGIEDIGNIWKKSTPGRSMKLQRCSETSIF